MTTEDKLKEFIVMKYGSLFNFSKVIGFPHSTLVSILKRGVNTASINNIGILCTALHISVDALAEGNIVELEFKKKKDSVELLDMINKVVYEMKNHNIVTLDKKEIPEDKKQEIINFLNTYMQVVASENKGKK